MFFIANIIRYSFIKQQLINLLKSNNLNNSFPVNVLELFKLVPNCKVMTYQQFADKYNTDIDFVINMCKSKSGCTHYDNKSKNYLVLYNNSNTNHNVNGRILWTLAHELGHIILKHVPRVQFNSIAENGFNEDINKQFETEADFFAANLLSPFQLFKPLEINSSSDIQNIFGLSAQASNFRWENYQKWKQNHIKTAFDNDILKLFRI